MGGIKKDAVPCGLKFQQKYMKLDTTKPAIYNPSFVAKLLWRIQKALLSWAASLTFPNLIFWYKVEIPY